jgi:hypothetical protein
MMYEWSLLYLFYFLGRSKRKPYYEWNSTVNKEIKGVNNCSEDFWNHMWKYAII